MPYRLSSTNSSVRYNQRVSKYRYLYRVRRSRPPFYGHWVVPRPRQMFRPRNSLFFFNRMTRQLLVLGA
jgi:hypothetical protein